jgi:general nucleoside transport system permease protein
MGIPVVTIQSACVVVGCALAGLGGAYLVVAQVGAFVENMVAGRGFLAIACVVFGRWRPVGALVAAIGFGMAEAAQIRLQTTFPNLPYQFLVMLPYLFATVALAFSSRSSALPRALGHTVVID